MKGMSAKTKCAYLGLVFMLISQCSWAIESPSSDGEVALLDNPVFRIPMLKELPKVDGKISEKEWSATSALSAFWSNNVSLMLVPRYEHLAPHQIQSQVHAGYSKTHLYLLYKIKYYPKKSWLKSRGRFPDVYNHPLYGIMQDDHLEIELRPVDNIRKYFSHGFFKWYANPLGVISDQHYSVKGDGRGWQSQADVKCGVTPDEKWWFMEMAVPFASLQNLRYKDENLVRLPPPDNTAYRVWFKNGIGGLSNYVVLFDQHAWQKTKTRMILDSQSVAFQLNELGPIMEDMIDVRCTLVNHSDRSQSVRLGFFMENEDGLIFSSYEQEQTQAGLVELRPGERRQVHYRKKFPGISPDNNFLWFDVRTSGRPSKVIFQNRIGKFHSTEPPKPHHVWREKKLGVIQKMRPPKRDFSFNYQFSPYTHKLSAVVDKGIHGASEEAKRAIEAQLSVIRVDESEEEILSERRAFNGNFATFLMQLPQDLEIGNYQTVLLLFDKDQMIVGERNQKPFYKGKFAWEKNRLGKEDVVWEPYHAISRNDLMLDTLKIRYVLDPSGLPAQIYIKPDERELPLEKRGQASNLEDPDLIRIGRGAQLRAPIRFEAIVDGKRLQSEIIEPAKLIKDWKSEQVFESKSRLGPVTLTLVTRIDCDGAAFYRLKYASPEAVNVELLEMVMDTRGEVDVCTGGDWGVSPASGKDISLPMREGIVWDSAVHMEPMELYYSRFVPFMHFGNGDRGFSYACDSDEDFMLDQKGTTMTLERDKNMEVTWRLKFINHRVSLKGDKEVNFALRLNPSKPRERGHRNITWMYWRPEAMNGLESACLPNDRPWGLYGSDETLAHFKKSFPNGAPRLYLANWVASGEPELQSRAYIGEWLGDGNAGLSNAPIDRVGTYGQPWNKPGGAQTILNYGSKSYCDYYTYCLERQIRMAGVTGWWWDVQELPGRGEVVSNGTAYFRDPASVGDKELPWQSTFVSLNYMDMFKRLARLFKKNGVPNYTSLWAGVHPALLESYANASELTERAAANHSSYELDNITEYPIPYFRFMANSNRGLNTRINLYSSFHAMPGDELRFDRGIVARALLHDIGVSHHFNNYEQQAKIKNALLKFGLFDDEQTEFIPYWRSKELFRYGELYRDDGFSLERRNPHEKVYVSAYRRPLPGVPGGYKVMFVIANEEDEDVRGRLHLLDVKKLLGGANNVTASWMYKSYDRLPETRINSYLQAEQRYALQDLESGGVVTRAVKGLRKVEVKNEVYGPIHIPAHNFRLLYAQHHPKVKMDVVKAKWDSRMRNLKHDYYSKKKDAWWKDWNVFNHVVKSPSK